MAAEGKAIAMQVEQFIRKRAIQTDWIQQKGPDYNSVEFLVLLPKLLL